MNKSKRASTIIHTSLEDGRPVCIRTIRSEDIELMKLGIGRMSDRSRYLRFFSGAKEPPPWVLQRLLDADGEHHLAWGAIDSSDPAKPAIGAVHAFRDDEHEECAEFSIAVLDEYHGRGLGKLMTATLLLAAREEGIEEFVVHMLGDNTEAREFTRSLGGKFERQDAGVLEYHLAVHGAIDRLRAECDPPGIVEVFAVFDETQADRGR